MRDERGGIRPRRSALGGWEAGNVLLLSLFVLSSVLIGSAAVSTIVIRDLRAARVSDDGHAALYAAETGAEGALYALRKTDATVSSLASSNGTLANGATWLTQALQGEPEFFVPSIASNDFVELNLFNQDDLSQSSGIESLSFEWEDDCGGCTSLEVSYTQWIVGATFTWPPNPNDYTNTFWKFVRPWASGKQYMDDFTGTYNYRVRLRNSLGMNQTEKVRNLRVRAYGDDAHAVPKDMPSRVFVNVTGTSGRAAQTLSIAMQRLVPLSGIFGSVIFSEADIIK